MNKVIEYFKLKRNIRKKTKELKKTKQNALVKIINQENEINDLKNIIKELNKELEYLQTFENRDALLQKINDQQMLIDHYHELKRYYKQTIRDLKLEVSSLKNK